MTKKFWTSLVFGLILVSPALMVGCGEETPKTDVVAPVTPVTPATPVATPGEGAKPTTTTTTPPTTTTTTPAPAPVK